MKTVQKTILIRASPEKVFEFMDDVRNMGMHMSRDSRAMMGSHLDLEMLSENTSGPGASYRWKGKVMGMTIDFTMVVTKWIKDIERVWETIGEPKVIVIGKYSMFLKLAPADGSTMTTLGISYEKPKDFFGKVLEFFLGKWYCNWCLNNMLHDAQSRVELNSQSQQAHSLILKKTVP